MDEDEFILDESDEGLCELTKQMLDKWKEEQRRQKLDVNEDDEIKP